MDEIEQKIYELEQRIDRIESMLARNSVQPATVGDNSLDAPPPTGSLVKFWAQFYVSGRPKEWKGGDGVYVPVIYGAKGEKASLGIYNDKLTIELHDGQLYRAFVNKVVNTKVYRGEEREFTTLWVEMFDTEFGNAKPKQPEPEPEPELPNTEQQPDMDVPF